MKKVIGYFLIAMLASITTLALYKKIKPEEQKFSYVGERSDANTANQPIVRFANLTSSPEAQIDFTVAAKKTIDAVVHVKTKYEGETVSYYDPFYDFLWGGGGKQYEYKTPQRQGSGSGVIISNDGYIVTNNHVIQNADNIEVTLNNKRTYTAKVIGTDPSTDISLIKIDERDLPFITYGNSDEVLVGQWTLAVGNPYNLTSTVTAGIISAKGRNIDILRDKFKIESYLQTDAAVNPGNSGGALVNTKGELIGLISAIASPTGSYSGYSFAIPVNMVKKAAADLREFGAVQRAFIGVSIQNMDSELADQLKVDVIKGVYVNGITEEGAAKDAGIKTGDIITNIDNQEVNNVPEFQEQIGKFRPGDKINITIQRNGKKMEMPIALTNQYGNTSMVKESEDKLVLLGGTFAPVSNAQKEKLGLENGVQVIKLSSGKLKSSGIGEGFIIIKIDKKKIYSVDDVSLALKDKKGGVLIEGVYSNGMKAYYGFGL